MGEDDFEKLRERRKLQMMKQQEQQNGWRRNGHGRYMELADQSDFFEAVKKSKHLAIHFYRGTTERCQHVDAAMSKLCGKHLETRYCKIDAEKSPFLCERLNIVVMPTILLIEDSQTVHQIRGFDELGGTDNFHPDTLAWVISQHGCGKFDGEPPEDPNQASAGRGVNRIGMSRRVGGVRDADEFGSDEDD
jgi:hypothetical protein